MAGAKIRTASGFECEVDRAAIWRDYEAVELIAKLDKANVLALPPLLDIVLGSEQTEKLKDHLRKDGRVETAAMFRELTEILAGDDELKN